MNSLTPGAVPPNYHEVLYWKITQSRGRLVILNLIAIPLLLVSSAFFFLFAVLFGRVLEAKVTGSTTELVVLLVAIAILIVLHELTHGITAQFYGAHPQYGFLWKGLMFYATMPGYAFTRNQYLVVILMPLVGLSLVAMIGIIGLAGSSLAVLLTLCAIFNATGAIGDLWILLIVVRYPPQAYIVDERDGLRVFLPM
jgi:hypothetical protein